MWNKIKIIKKFKKGALYKAFPSVLYKACKQRFLACKNLKTNKKIKFKEMKNQKYEGISL
ncbi:hypothetical protein bcgnr5384_56400 [Bacillus cereus]